MTDMNLREMLETDFGIDFPISGGTGNSRESPIVVHYQQPNDYVGVEYGVLQCVGAGRPGQWKLVRQTLLEYNGRKLDEVQIETQEAMNDAIITQNENYYFDITECLGR
jgi:hypothetical protein